MISREKTPSDIRARIPTGRASLAGMAHFQLVFGLAILALVAGSTYYYMKHRAMADAAVEHLRLMYMALEMYEIDRGHLPTLTFFPDDARHDNDSLLMALGRYGVDESLTICPTAPPILRELGLNYVWNVRMNGKKLHEPGVRDWMLTEMHALSEQVPPPHLGRYTILYSDGKVERSASPPPGLRMP